MAIYYNVVGRKNPAQASEPEAEVKYYAVQKTLGTIKIAEIAETLSVRSGHSEGSVMGICQDLIEAIAHFVSTGSNVNLGGLGYMQARLYNEVGTPTEDTYSIPVCKKKFTVQLRPSYKLESKLSKAELRSMKATIALGDSQA
jgi:nucleoid DNA-binding protein